MKKIIYILIALSIIWLSFLAVNVASAQFVMQGVQGGTGLSSATVGEIGFCIKVSDDNPLTYVLGTCGSGSGSGESIWTRNVLTGLIYAPTTTDVLGLGITATSTNSKLEVNGTTTASLFTASSTTATSTLPNIAANWLRGTFPLTTTAGILDSGTNNLLLINDNGMIRMVNSTPIQAQSKRVLILGSSTAIGSGASSYATSWAGRLEAALTARGFETFNMSLAGDTTAGNITRFYKDVAAFKPDFVILANAPRNDGMLTNPTNAYALYLGNTKKLVQMVEQIGALPILAIQVAENSNSAAGCQALKDIYQQVEHWGIEVWDFLNPVVNPATNCHYYSDMFDDGIHPNNKGHLAMFNAIPLSYFDMTTTKHEYMNKEAPQVWKYGTDVSGVPLEVVTDTVAPSWSVGGWIKDDGGSLLTYMSVDGDANYPRIRNSTGVYEMAYSGSAIITSTVSAVDRKFNHLMMTYHQPSLTAALYINANLIGTSTMTMTASSTGACYMGRCDALFQVINGQLSQPVYYRTALNADQVKEVYNGEIPKYSLEYYSPLGAATSTFVANFAETNATGTAISGGAGFKNVGEFPFHPKLEITNSTTTSATSTNLFATKASTTNLFLATGACDSLDTDSTGKVVCGSDAGAGGTVDGTGVANTIATWVDSDTITATSSHPLYVGAIVSTSTITSSFNGNIQLTGSANLVATGTAQHFLDFEVMDASDGSDNRLRFWDSTTNKGEFYYNIPVGGGVTQGFTLQADENIVLDPASSRYITVQDGDRLGFGSGSGNNTDGYISYSSANTRIDFISNAGIGGGSLSSFYFNSGLQDTDFIVGGDTDGSLIFADASTDKVGIGTSSPYAKLSVNGETVSAFFTATTTTNSTFPRFIATLSTTTSATTTNFFSQTASTTNLFLALGACDSLDTDSTGRVICGTDASGGGGGAATDKFSTSSPPFDSIYVNGGLNTGVGIGTTTPAWALQVASSTRPQLALTDSGAGTNSKHWIFRSTGGDLYVGTSSDALIATSTYLTIKNGGNVGIGTASPYEKLTVIGAAAVVHPTSFAVVMGSTTGNDRGLRALDVQSFRSIATRVASGQDSVAVGNQNTASGAFDSVALGSQNTATGTEASAVGTDNFAWETDSNAFGSANNATSTNSNAFGTQNNAGGSGASPGSAFGYDNDAWGADSNAFGNSNTVTGTRASAFGNDLDNNTTDSVVIGSGNNAKVSFFGASPNVGSVSIGTTTPYGKLTVGSHNGTQPLFVVSTSSDALASTTVFIVDRTGNVGVGTTTPYAKLSVDGQGVFNQDIRFNYFTGTSTAGNGTSTLSSGGFVVNTDKFVVGSGDLGRVNIGTTTEFSVPFTILSENADLGVARFIAQNAARNANFAFENIGDANDSWALGRSGIGTLNIQYLATYPFAPGTASTFMTIEQSGDIGIGDITPASLLTVGNGDLFQVDSSGRVFLPAGASGAGNLALSTTGDTNTGLYFAGADEMRFQTGGVDRVNITATGNVGVGSTTDTAVLSVGKEIKSGFFTSTSTTATSTFVGDLRFDAEILPDGVTCSAGQILKKTGANDWDCASDDTGAGGGGGNSKWATSTNLLGIHPNTIAMDVWLGSTATSTAPFWWDVSATTSYIGNGLGGSDSLTQYGPDNDAWAVGFKLSDKSFRIASSTALGSNDVVTITKNLRFGISTTTPSSAFSVGGSGSATTTLFIDSGIGKGACLALKDSDGTGFTYVSADDGVLTASATTCQ